MAIEGPVRELALSDLLQLLFLSRRTGRLIVSDDSAGNSTVLEIESGVLVGATTSSPETRLGQLLIGSGRATEDQVSAALAAQRLTPDLRLGEILVEQGAVRDVEIRRQLRLQVEEAVFDLLRWQDGHLRFEEGGDWPTRSIEVRLATDGVLMEATRRLDEWAEVTASAPDPDPLPQLASANGGSGTPLTLEPLEWEVLAKVDGEQTLRRIARSLGRAELDVARAIYSLALLGVVEIGARAQAARNGGHVAGGDTLESEIRIVEGALRAGSTGEADRRLSALLDRWPGSAALHLLRGRVLAERGDLDAAAVVLDHAVGLDPLLAPAYYHLAHIAIRRADFERGRTALSTYERLSDTSYARRTTAARMSAALEQLLAALEEVGE
jgi:hypothetical protein